MPKASFPSVVPLPCGLLEQIRLPPAIMGLGTSSDAGKSLLAAGLCRLFARRGLNVAPFKSQNMALNSAVTDEGKEMGRAQALQARACGLRPDVRMNPVLLKPQSQAGSQVIVMGEARGHYRVREYERLKPVLFREVCEAYASLARGRDLMILEGAGSPAEINLRAADIVNSRMAREARARMIVVGDIDRGGVFASLTGTLALMEKWEQDMVDGLVINKFRGDASLLPPALDAVAALTGKPFLGVVPWVDDLLLPEEDSVSYRAGRILRREAAGADDAGLREDELDVALIDVPYLSNLSDMDPLLAEPGVRVRMVTRPEELGRPDLIVLPGSKSTASDLRALRKRGMEEALHGEAGREGGADILGICGGMQMMGEHIADPDGLEDGPGHVEKGFGLLPLVTALVGEKVLRRAGAVDEVLGLPLSVYEIHHGRTEVLVSDSAEGGKGGCARTWTRAPDGGAHGWMLEQGGGRGTIWGTYGHGLFDDDAWRCAFLNRLRRRRGKSEGTVTMWSPDASLDRLADALEKNLDMGRMCARLSLPRSLFL